MHKLWCNHLKDNFVVIENSVLEAFLVTLRNAKIGAIGKVIKTTFNISYGHMSRYMGMTKGAISEC